MFLPQFVILFDREEDIVNYQVSTLDEMWWCRGNVTRSRPAYIP